MTVFASEILRTPLNWFSTLRKNLSAVLDHMVLKRGGVFVEEAIVDLIQSSMEEECVPELLKWGWITPIWKGSDPEEPVSYRPISLTSHIGKLMEKVIREQLVDFLSHNGLIEDDQHGSRKQRSTFSQLLNQHDLILDMLTCGENCDMVYLDMSKAFDMVDHCILLRKMKDKGVGGLLLRWMYQFLTDRKQSVRVGNNLSSKATLVSGVPQGSLLGPVCFLLYIGDLGEEVKDFVHILKYVDDS